MVRTTYAELARCAHAQRSASPFLGTMTVEVFPKKSGGLKESAHKRANSHDQLRALRCCSGFSESTDSREGKAPADFPGPSC